MADTRIETLKQALKMETDGRDYYKQAMDRTKSKLAKDIFKSLFIAEEKHAETINQIYKSLVKTGEWPKQASSNESTKSSENIFVTAMFHLDESNKGSITDIEALNMAVKLEDKGIKYYQSKANESDDPFEKNFYLLLAHEEKEHYLSLMETIEYLEDPQSYFGQRERGTMSS